MVGQFHKASRHFHMVVISFTLKGLEEILDYRSGNGKYHLKGLTQGHILDHLCDIWCQHLFPPSRSPPVSSRLFGLKPATSLSCASSLQAAAGPDSNGLVFSLLLSRKRRALCVN